MKRAGCSNGSAPDNVSHWMTSRRWILIALGVLLFFVLGMGALVGSCAYLVRKQVQVREQSSSADYERESTVILRRFKGVPPLVEDTPSGPRVSPGTLERRQAAHTGAAPDALHVLVFARDERKLVRLSIPFWLLRLAPDGNMDINVDELRLDRLRLSVEDLERAGPGLLLVREDEDTRVLVWTE